MRHLARRPLGWMLFLLALSMLLFFPRLIDALKALEHEPVELKSGSLLVARPGRVSGAFDETVVLLLDAGAARSTWGLVLNRVRTQEDQPLPVGVDRWGGPVRAEHRITLTLRSPPPEGAHPLPGGLSWYEGSREPHLPVGSSLTFEGLAAWAPGQLEEELARGGWWVMEGRATDVFSAPGSLWVEHAARHL
ncbi:hypothetical protein FJV41_29875 [Myxococcus llanfairpwllgwyngyllgogerychwyrndrobwllllantysiliogogogochensis]|uniref:Uncharacterized protein n=1 Tax=Myxococcus llanfairpwllgwyngyllgogerychwyrndrobwllllantysiliogogogochensis TaxID=2590453 RepID=A0A540WTC6_9BACT|nr:YqgE/AlgH family protein [Myxococcus llanfairpwllgwyngyllgogerychwyrndrobwllllantysiliogogogochensis]TQF12266.1 hypothetical protein FJV41_29875 [Myxococcus llanfairpwllgwyngyllgogerychwyrndrobwllllantysiliogogogochensis]